jgi:hypothetical protein
MASVAVPLAAGGVRARPTRSTRGTRHWAAAARVGSGCKTSRREGVEGYAQQYTSGAAGRGKQLCVAASLSSSLSSSSSSSAATRASSRLGGHQRRRGGAVAAKAGGANVDDKDDVVGEEPVVGQSKSLGFDFNKEMQADMERLAADSPLAKVGALYSC